MKKKIFLIIFLILAVAISLFLYLGGQRKNSLPLLEENKKVPNTSLNEICLKIFYPDNIYYCLAAVNKDDSYCQSDMPSEKKLCQATALRDVSVCREIEEAEPKKVCYYEVGFLTGKFNYCEETEDPNMCYFAFVYRLHWESRADEIKAEYCEKFDVSSPDGKIFKNCCLAFKERDSSLCQGNRYCESFFKQSLSFCDTEFELPGGGLASKDECLLHRALSEKDSSFCAKIESEEGRDGCYADISTHISPDISFCDKVINKMIRDMCYAEAAIYFSEN